VRYRYLTADVFTDRPFTGNPLAVFPLASGLDAPAMQRIARELNLSETVFVFAPRAPEHTRRLRIFTPAAELPFAGHPTVGAAFVLAAIGEIPLATSGSGGETRIVLEEVVGPVPVTVRSRDGRPTFAQLSVAKLPERGPPPPPAGDLASLLSLEPDDLLGGDLAPQAFSCGVPFLFVPVRSREVLRRVRVDHGRWTALLSSWWARDVFVFALDPEDPAHHVRARMFAPELGIAEDPATGAAAAALAGYLASRERRRDGVLRWVIEQGYEMGRPSLIRLAMVTQAGKLVSASIGGDAVVVTEGTLEA
jgi:trans-2,3-dihydro-3-hydroxyanthranilate isomerase